MGYKTAPDGSISLSCGLYQFMLHTELLFKSEGCFDDDVAAVNCP